MIPVLTPQEASRVDAASPVPVDVLMDRAGLGVALAAVRMGIGYGDRVVVLAGPGNNGGDGYVAARHLHRRGVGVEVGALADPKTDAASRAAERAAEAGVHVAPIGSVGKCSLVVDAVFGGGFRSGIPETLRAWMAADVPVLAVDVPTGLDPGDGTVPGDAFRAAATVTFHALKTGHVLGEGPDRCGRVTIVDIGLEGGEPALRLAEDIDAPRPARSRTVHKWAAGAVLVVGGAPGMVGAAVMAARSALHFGAGSVGVAVPEDSRPVVAALAPEVLSYTLDVLDSVRERFDVLLVGPGLGGAGVLVGSLMDAHRGAMVLDADGIDAVAPDDLARRQAPTVITPHAGEFRHLTGLPAGADAARHLAADTGTVTLLKGNPTFVTDGDSPWVVTSNGPELASIGTGDVLAGMTAALLARGVPPLEAGISAAHWHGVAGADLRRSRTVTADALSLHVGRFAWDDL